MEIKYPIKFKAAILEEVNKPLNVEEIVFQGPLEPGQVLVRIHYSGICGKQIEEIEGTRPDPYLPHLLGHEGGGIVVDIGPGVKKVIPGDYVVLHWLKGSGINSQTPTYNYAKDGRRINAGWITTFNEYGVISENRITKIPENTRLDIVCLLGCCVTSGLGVIFNEAKPLPGDSVAVFGCGGVGLNAIQAAALMHAYPIIAVDINDKSLELAKEFGATHFVNPNLVNVVEEIKRTTNPHGKEIKDAKNFNLKEAGADYIISCVSNPKAIEDAVSSGSIPGTVFFVGVPPYFSKITVNAFDIHASKVLRGSSGGGTFPDKDILRYLNLYNKGIIKLEPLIFKRITLENVNEGIKSTKSQEIGRCIIDMT
ncbi:MAG: zinc-binding dehydrogenase [Nanoarchaeota archaeon]